MRSAVSRRRLAILMCAALLISGSAVAIAQDEEQRLAEARAALARIAGEIETAESSLGDAEDELANADERLAEIEQVVNQIAADVEQQRASVGDAQRRVDEVEREAQELTAAFEDRIARLYKQGPELTFELLLSSEGADEAIARTVLLERVTEGDQVDLERLDVATTVVETEHERLQGEQETLEEMLDEQEDLLAQAEELRASRALEAADARSQLTDLEGAHDDLEDEEARLEELIRQRQLEEQRRREAAERAAAQRAAEQRAAEQRAAEQAAQQRAEETSPAPAPAPAPADDAAPTNQGSGHVWPACGRITSEYGPRWGRMHRGIDVGAPSGTTIRASRGGTVVFAGWQGGYGNLMLIDHGGGVVTAYAHQRGFAVGSGASVSQGQTIGYVGSTGNSTGPHLHFEVRINGSAVNPRQYLSGSPC